MASTVGGPKTFKVTLEAKATVSTLQIQVWEWLPDAVLIGPLGAKPERVEFKREATPGGSRDVQVSVEAFEAEVVELTFEGSPAAPYGICKIELL